MGCADATDPIRDLLVRQRDLLHDLSDAADQAVRDYDAWQETVDRSRAALGQPRRGYAEVAEYQARVRELREEKRRVVGR